MEIEKTQSVSNATTKRTRLTCVEIVCADCGLSFDPSISKNTICITCISKKYDISEGITKQAVLNWCRYCKRYQRPPWVYCEIESKELLSICLKKICGLKKVKLMDAAFRWTEEHSKRIRVEITIRKEVNVGIFLEQSFEVEYVVNWVQCDDCKKDFTPHTWVSCVQIRQRADHKKTFLYLEQIMLKLGIANKALKIAEEPDGLDFFFRSKNNALQVVSFFQSLVPYQQKDSKELVSADIHTGTADYKYSHILELPKVCRDDLVVLPVPLAKELGGVNAIGVVYKIGTAIHCYDPVTLRLYEINAKQYWAYEQDLVVVPFRGQETKFTIQDIQEDHASAGHLNTTFSNIQARFARVDVMKESDLVTYSTTTHLGHILKHGDTVLGFDMNAVNCTEDFSLLKHQRSLPDVILMRKSYPETFRKKKIWKLKRLDIEENDQGGARKKYDAKRAMDIEEFEEEIMQDKGMRKHINLYRNEEVIQEKQKKKEAKAAPAEKKEGEITDEKDDEWATDSEEEFEENNPEIVQLGELLADLNLDEKGDAELDGEIEDLVDIMDKVRVGKKK